MILPKRQNLSVGFSFKINNMSGTSTSDVPSNAARLAGAR